jgi:hypothetical protein
VPLGATASKQTRKRVAGRAAEAKRLNHSQRPIAKLAIRSKNPKGDTLRRDITQAKRELKRRHPRTSDQHPQRLSHSHARAV